jgi:N-acetylmuramoyl-L-alanine amidase
MRRTILNIVSGLLLFVGSSGAGIAMTHNDYGGCDGNCEQRLEVASQNCLAETIYYEAGNQPTKGKVAVAFVIFNRMKKYNSTLCDVVQQRGQFFWVSSPSLRRRPKNQKQWEDCQALAKDILVHPEKYHDPTNGARAFRGPKDAPFPEEWVESATIGGHIFYTLP